MASVYESILAQLGPDEIAQISRQLGVDQRTAQQGVQAGLPVLLSALARNAQSPSGAASLSRALRKDHDGSALNNLSEVLGGYRQGEGDGILRHTLGDQRQVVEQGLSQQSGLDGGALLQMLAPIVLGALGQQQRQQGMDAGDLAGMLQQEQQQMAGGGMFDLLGSLLGGGLAGGGAQGGMPPGLGTLLAGGLGAGTSGTGGDAGLAGAVGGGPIVQMLMSLFGPTLIQQIADRFGIDKRLAQQVVMIAIPLLLSALARNAATKPGAESLYGALERDHDGSVLNNLGEVLDNPSSRKGDKIVKKVLGDQAPSIAQTLTDQTGVDGGQLLQTLAPIVLGVLGMQTRQQGLDANGLSAALQQERGALEQSNNDMMGIVGQLLGTASGGQQSGGDLLGMLGQLLGGR